MSIRSKLAVLAPMWILAACVSAPSEDRLDRDGGSAGGSGSGSAGGGQGKAGSTGWAGGGIQTGMCGDKKLDSGEKCDDGNIENRDGCNELCQVEDGWACPTVGAACERTMACGNGALEGDEQCDDGDKDEGDGCSASCAVETGWQCRIPGRPCSPLCGDGLIVGTEQCDDNNADKDDGCSPNCLREPGATCSGAPSVCTVAVCGNGKEEAGESCDRGELNGLFFGDGTGCSKTCTKEPTCRSATGETRACDPSCGNGNVETGEACDDGNRVDGDGCSSTCTQEQGWDCKQEPKPDTQPCKEAGNTGECLRLPVIYRNFKNESVAGGHPDFFYLGAPVSPAIRISGVDGQPSTFSFNKRYCVPNSSGPAKANDSTPRCWDIAAPRLDASGKPVFNATRNGGGDQATLCDCQFTDWSHDTNGGHVPGYAATNSPLQSLAYSAGKDGHPMYHGPAPVVTSAKSFGQWWIDSPSTNDKHTVGGLELASTGKGVYRFSSASHSIHGGFFPLDPTENHFPLYSKTGSTTGPGTARTSATANGEALLCNLWPYWYSSTSFGAGNQCKGDQYLFPPSVDIVKSPNGEWATDIQGWYHDSWFSVEVRYLFAFHGPFELQFYGDDDTFVYINGVLVIDLGGVHQRLPGKVSVDANGAATIQEGGALYLDNSPKAGDMVPCSGSDAIDPLSGNAFNATCPGGTCDCRTRTVPLGLQQGNTYEIAIFERDGHPSESNFQLTLSPFSTVRSYCGQNCGDGVVAGSEECDCGDPGVTSPAGCNGLNNDDHAYGGCTHLCQYGPYCGDGKVTEPEEECDHGTKNNTARYGADGCTPGCKKPHRCGDGILDSAYEVCDFGAQNGQGRCAADCTVVPN